MKIDVLCNDGSPLGVTMKSLFGEDKRIGVGGSEYALLTMCELWKISGHDVVLYNNPYEPYGSSFEQRTIQEFEPNEKRDVVINFRSPNEKTIVSKGLKVWWSCDQYTVGDYAKFSQYVDKIVCISDFHAEHFRIQYGIENALVIDLPVRLFDFNATKVDKIPNKLLFNSVPDRGLHHLLAIWKYIKNEMPEVTLTITSDYRLWGVGQLNEQHRLGWLSSAKEGVRFLGAIKRGQLIEEQLSSDLLVYPCTYDELFCVAVAEAQCSGVYPITSNFGALSTTNMGKQIGGHPSDPGNTTLYGNAVLELLQDRKKLEKARAYVRERAIGRFSGERILKEWDRKVFE